MDRSEQPPPAGTSESLPKPWKSQDLHSEFPGFTQVVVFVFRALSQCPGNNAGSRGLEMQSHQKTHPGKFLVALAALFLIPRSCFVPFFWAGSKSLVQLLPKLDVVKLSVNYAEFRRCLGVNPGVAEPQMGSWKGF